MASSVRAASVPLGLLVLLTLSGAVLLLLQQWLSAAFCMALGLASGIWWLLRLRHNRQAEADHQEARQLLAQYQCETGAAMLEAALTRRDWLLWLQQRDRQSWELDVLLEETASFAPHITTAEQAQQAVEAALTLLDRRYDAERELERAKRLQENSLPQTPPELHRMQLRCASLEAQANTLREQLTMLGGWEKYDHRQQTLEQEIRLLQQRERALTLAMEALESAEQQMRRVYAPRLTGLAGERLTWITGGQYDGLILQQGFELLVRERESGLTRPLAALSRGAQDQTWLALRLAMTDLLLPQDAPLILDDVLLTFDPARTAQALTALEQTGRQVLLFSCRPIL